jgi:hypothetical protein
MGRELRRVPLDFDWPLNKVWQGYVPPEWRPCPSDDCENGSTVVGAWIEAIAHLLLMVGEAGITGRSLHPWLEAVPLAPRKKPGPQSAEFSGGLAGRAPAGPFGHDACDRWAATKAIIKAAGLPDEWGTCPTCKGHAIHPDDLEASETWKGAEPPEGAGYQLWETTSEGSPVSPVFATLDELCEYAAANCSTFGHDRASAEGWKAMLTDGIVAARHKMPGGGEAIFI